MNLHEKSPWSGLIDFYIQGGSTRASELSKSADRQEFGRCAASMSLRFRLVGQKVDLRIVQGSLGKARSLRNVIPRVLRTWKHARRVNGGFTRAAFRQRGRARSTPIYLLQRADPYFAIGINLAPDRRLNCCKLNRTASITHLFPSRPTICRSFRNRPVARVRRFFTRRAAQARNLLTGSLK